MFKKLRQFEVELMADLTCDAYNITHNPTKKQKAGIAAYTASAAVLGTTVSALAAPQFFSQLENMMVQMYGWILGISTALAILLLAFRLIQYMAASDPQEAKMAKDKAKKVLIAWVLINILGALPPVIKTLTQGNSWRGQTGTFK